MHWTDGNVCCWLVTVCNLTKITNCSWNVLISKLEVCSLGYCWLWVRIKDSNWTCYKFWEWEIGWQRERADDYSGFHTELVRNRSTKRTDVNPAKCRWTVSSLSWLDFFHHVKRRHSLEKWRKKENMYLFISTQELWTENKVSKEKRLSAL